MAQATGTALVYDEQMSRYKLLWLDPACELEVPERLTVSYEALVQNGLSGRCVSVPVREATDAEILLAHSEEYLEAVKKTPYMSLEDLMTFTQQYGDVYFHPNIYHCAKLAIGAALQLVDNVMTGSVRNGLALVRPPGHHSQHSAANGFCVFNNVAIAAQYAKKYHGVKKVLIVDWDVHHGQGVQYCFEDDPSVLYFSWHRYEHQNFWPNLKESDHDSVGKGKGAGFNVNVPWNQVGMENSDYLAVFFHVLLPVAYEFGPDLVLVCAGFDSAIGDPEGHMCATPDIFAHLTHLLMNLAGGKLCAVLEGGYNLSSLAQSVCQTVLTLLGDPAPRPTELHGPCESALESIHCVRSSHKQYWSCLKHAADMLSYEPSTKHRKVMEGALISQNQDEQGQKTEEGSTTELVFPELLQRVAPAVRTALVLPDAVECTDGCAHFSAKKAPDPLALNRLSMNGKESGDEASLTALANLIPVIEKMEKNEIQNCLALVPDVSTAAATVVQQANTSLTKRVLVVWVGEGPLPTQMMGDEKTLLVHLGSKEQEDLNSKYYVPISLKKGCRDTAGLLQALLGVLLPLGFQFNPSLVLLVRTPGGNVATAVWQQLTCLLQGLAQGRTLVLMQEKETSSISATASCLLGYPAPSLGPLAAPMPDNVEALERLGHRLQAHWKLLQTTAPDKKGNANKDY